MTHLNYAIRIVEAIRDICLSKYPLDIDVVLSMSRDDRLGIEQSDLAMYPDLQVGVIFKMASLMKSPRILKLALRRTVHAWTILHGEIDFEDLLVVNVLRHAAPEAFDFILDHVNEIRALGTSGIMNDQSERKKYIHEKWKHATEKGNWDNAAAEGLLAFLFPSWKTGTFTELRNAPLQGIRHAEPTDYWVRANLEDLSDVTVRDQEVLKSLKNWKADNNASVCRGLDLGNAIYKIDGFSDKVEQFGKLFLDGKEIRTIASALFRLVITEKGVKANERDIPVLAAIWRLALDSPISQYEHDQWIKGEITGYLPRGLRFANDLYYFWRHNDRNSVETKQPSGNIRSAIIKEAKTIFVGSPQILISSLDPQFIYSVYHFAVLYSREEHGGPGFEPKEWTWITDLLLEAAKIEPTIALPQIATLIFDISFDPFAEGDNKYRFNAENASALLGEKIEAVMQLFADGQKYDFLAEREQGFLEYVRTFASNWFAARAIKKHNNSEHSA